MATTLANISIKDNSSWNTLLNLVYPVGSFYLSQNSTSPASRFGGTWSQLNDDKYLRCGTWGSGGSNSASHSHTGGSYHAMIAPQYQGARWTHYQIEGVSAWSSDYALALTDSWLDAPGVKPSNAVPVEGNSSSASVTITPNYREVYCWYRTK